MLPIGPRRLLLTLVLLPAGAGATPVPQLYDPGYAYRETSQRDWVRRRVRQIIAPTITFPALVPFGGRLQILIHMSSDLESNRLLLMQKDRWRVYLSRGGDGPTYPCHVREAQVERDGLRLGVQVPAKLARDVYTLGVMGPGIDDRQPNAVRIHGAKTSDSYRFAVLTDHQLWDPSSRVTGRQLNAGVYPRNGQEQDHLAITRQGLAEITLLDPEFVIYLGDMVFGVDYPKEYDQAFDLLHRARLPIFAVPGNHDGYANYVVKLRGSALELLAGAWGCRRHLQGELSWEGAWRAITCLYGDVKELMYADLHRDGLVFWQRQLGPTAYAFDHGKMRFVALNTYDGTPKRRHAFSIYTDAWDIHLGAPAVDNYGGYLSDAQLGFVERQARLADSLQQTLVVFGHHDPRGNESGQRFHPNDPFPTNPIGLGGFEEWNFDSESWDSDDTDGRGPESPGRNSGLALLKILAHYGGYYLFGHGHRDERTVYSPGSSLLGKKVRKRLELIRTTTAASSVREDDGYWGYRLIQVDGDRLSAVDYAPEHRLSSVPVGNLWIERPTEEEVSVTSGLPRSTRVNVRWDLPTIDQGYRFKAVAVSGKTTAGPISLQQPRVHQVLEAGQTTTYWIDLDLAAAGFPPSSSELVSERIKAVVARGNQPPVGVMEVSTADGLKLQLQEDGFDAVVGQVLLFSAEQSHDPQGDRIVTFLWQLGQERSARGKRLAHRFSGPGPRTIRLTVVDEAGAQSTVSRIVSIQAPRPPGCRGCCADQRELTGVEPAMLLIALMVLGGALRRRRSQ